MIFPTLTPFGLTAYIGRRETGGQNTNYGNRPAVQIDGSSEGACIRPEAPGPDVVADDRDGWRAAERVRRKLKAARQRIADARSAERPDR
jgi:hypothetical protein